MWRAKVMADAGLRQNGRWKYGSRSELHRSVQSRSAQNAISRAGLILDYLSDVVLSITTSRSRTETSYWIAIIQ